MDCVYRRVIGTNLWHFQSDCEGWPTSRFYEIHEEPLNGRICIECILKSGNEISDSEDLGDSRPPA